MGCRTTQVESLLLTVPLSHAIFLTYTRLGSVFRSEYALMVGSRAQCLLQNHDNHHITLDHLHGCGASW